MVSAQVGGQLNIYVESASGTRVLKSSHPIYWYGPGGSSDGVIANTPEKWNALYAQGVGGAPGSKIVFEFIAGANATLDISDAVWILPVVVNGQEQAVGNSAAAGGIGNSNFTNTYTIGDVAVVANVPTVLAIYTAKESVHFNVGGMTATGSRCFLSVENNA